MMNFNNTARVILTAIILSFTSACSQENYRMQKYDPNMQALNNKAVVVLGTKNLSFIDFRKYSKQDTLKINKSEAPVAYVKEHNVPISTSSNTGKTTNAAPASADPNNVSYPKVKLSELFKRSERPAAPNPNNNEVVSSADASTSAINPEQLETYRVLKANKILISGYEKSIYTVDPGIYYISYAYCNDNDNDDERYTKLPGISVDGTVEYGAFEVKAGDVVYLGDITIDWVQPNSAKMFTIGGDIKAVKKDLLAAGYSGLAEKLEQAKFLARGYHIN